MAHVQPRFDPFEDRLSRDIRNQLSRSFRQALEKDDFSAVMEVADDYRGRDLPRVYEEYIDSRLRRYKRALQTIRKEAITSAWDRGLVLWDLELFFEVHEVLEAAWHRSSDVEKLLYQALIRAAGMYIKLTYGNLTGARKMADKAVSALEQHRQSLPEGFEVDLLLDKLRRLDPAPPRLSRFQPEE